MAYIKQLGWYITFLGKPDVTYQFIHKVISYLSMFISFLRLGSSLPITPIAIWHMALYRKTVTKKEGHWILSLKGQSLVLFN